ncbi:serine/threonine-protein kinase [Anabaena sp. UHCC 0399]|uniref:serine/threonine-protein kinase n=1 Tax=Anabaena sp. UHCC 0399 TaxID=3110238 RepID=UPI002B1F7DE2|nr:serine/threonine-protein kinase [Anabaena sp. UHCC 0399]MEA5566844.1 serine/threonine-protein kinase [Anabaena sp. UHCC 0399]
MNILQNRYRLVNLISRGGFCESYFAVDEGKSPPVVCVVQKLCCDNQRLDVVEQKAQLIKEIGQHPQIPALLAHFQENGNFYLVQEFIAGSNLAQIVEREGAFNETQTWQLLVNILPVLKFISDRHLIHCDIKPHNIIRSNSGNLVLVDFGNAQIASDINQLTTNTITGNPEYAAPEQIIGKAVFASDLYSLGVTCIYLLTQISPFDLFDIANVAWVWRQYLTTRISDRLGNILDKLLQKDITQRYQSADAVMVTMGIANTSTYSRGDLKSPNPWQCTYTFTETTSINALAISPDGKILASGGENKMIKLWDLETKTVINSLSGHSQGVTSVAFSPNGQVLATASDDKTVKLWHIPTSTEIYTLVGHSHAVKSVAFSPDGQILASGSWDKQIRLWDVETGAEIFSLQGHQLQVSAVAFSPDGQLLASASFDRTIRLWQLKNRQCYDLLETISGHTRAVLAIAFSPDGKILATGSDDNTIKFWDVNTCQLIGTLLGHSWAVVAVAFTADSKTLISASWDKTIKLWQVSTTQEITTLLGHVDSVTTVAVSQVAQLIASGSRDKTIKLWQFSAVSGSGAFSPC